MRAEAWKLMKVYEVKYSMKSEGIVTLNFIRVTILHMEKDGVTILHVGEHGVTILHMGKHGVTILHAIHLNLNTQRWSFDDIPLYLEEGGGRGVAPVTDS